MKKIINFVLILLFLSPAFLFASDEGLVQVESRGLQQKIILTKPESTPIASVILMAGGHGKLDLSGSSNSVNIGWGKNNNLVRTRQSYADQGFLVATMDAPSNRKKMNAIWRMGEEHAKDIESVASYLQDQANVPVWVIGTSMGSFSAANAGISLSDAIDGIVLTSSVTKSKKKWKIYDDFPDGVINMELSKVTIPVLVISHEKDKCKLTPAADLDNLASAFSSAPKVEKALFTGGDSPKSDPCKALSAHGFLGIEEQVVKRIANFIKSN